MDLFDLYATLSLDTDGYNSGIDTASTKTEGLSSKAVAFGQLAAQAIETVISKVADLATEIVNVGMESETAFAQLETIAGSDNIDELSDQLADLAVETGVSASELAITAYNAISAGTAAEDAAEMVETASKLATAGFTDTDSALSVLSTAINAYGLEADEATAISDSLIQVQNLGVTTVSELASSMGKAIATASAYSVDLSNLESSYISLTKAGISTEESTTYLSSMFNELGDSGSDVSAILQEQTGKTFGQLMEEGYSLADVLSIVNDSVDGDSEALMNLWGSAEAGKAASAIIGQGLDEFNENLQTLADSAGATETAYETMTDTLSYKTDVLSAAGENLMTALYDGMSGQLGEVVDFGSEAMVQLTAAFEEGGIAGMVEVLPELLTQAIEMIMGFLPDLITTVVDVVGALAEAIVESIPTMIEAVGEVSQSIIAAVPELILSLITALAEGLPDIISAGLDLMLGLVDAILEATPTIVAALPDVISALVEGLLGSIPEIIQAGIDLITSLVEDLPTIIETIVEAIPEIIDSIITAILDSIPEIIQAGIDLLVSLVENLPTIIATIVKAIPTIITSIVDALVGNIDQIILAGVQLFVALITNLPTIIVEIVKAIPEIISAIVEGFAGGMSDMAEIGLNLIKGIWNGLSDASEWLWNKVKGLFSTLTSKIKNFFGISSPSKVFAEIGDYLIEGLAEGIDETADEAVHSANSMASEVMSAVDDMAEGWNAGLESMSTEFNGIKSVGNLEFASETVDISSSALASLSGSGSNISVVQNIYSQAQTAADLLREARWEQERAVLRGVYQ